MSSHFPLITSGPAGTVLLSMLRAEVKEAQPADIPRVILERPDLVEKLLVDYAAAGADFILAPTMMANRLFFSNLSPTAEQEANRGLMKLAHKAALETDDTVTTAEVGALTTLFLDKKTDTSRAAQILTEQAQVLIGEGARHLMLETIISLEAAIVLTESVLEATIKEGIRPAVHVSLSPNEELRLSDGSPLSQVARRLATYEPESIGLNCVFPLSTAIVGAEMLLSATPLPLSLRPSTMLPGHNEVTPKQLADGLEVLLRNPRTTIVGTCCGGTPEHIKYLKLKNIEQ